MRTAPIAAALALIALALPADAQRRRREPAAPKLTEETLVPTELFPEADARRFGYGNGLESAYTRSDKGHQWKLNEPSMSEPPTASLQSAAETEKLPPTADDEQFTASVALVRPTFVTLVFTDSPEAARALVEAQEAARQNQDELREKTKLNVLKLEKDPRLGPASLVYNREFNLGDKTGGMRRASAILVAKGNIFLRVDAMGGLRDGTFELEENTLEKRARDVAAWVLRKL